MNLLQRLEGWLYRKLRAMSYSSSWYNDILFPDCKKFWKYGVFAPDVTFDIEVVNLGSTSGLHAFDYTDLKIRAENWALRQNPLSADLAILQNYSSFLKTLGATVIFPLCPFSALSGGYAFQEDRYYTILNPRSIPYFSSKRLKRILELRDNPISAYPVIDAISALKSAVIRRLHRAHSHQITKFDFAADAERWMKNWFGEFHLENNTLELSLVNQDGIEEATKYLALGIDFCHDHGFRPVLVIPPMHHTLAKLFTPELRKLLIASLLERLSDKKIEFFNYIDAEEFSLNDELFRDAFLLNAVGAKRFTQRVLNDLGIVK